MGGCILKVKEKRSKKHTVNLIINVCYVFFVLVFLFTNEMLHRNLGSAESIFELAIRIGLFSLPAIIGVFVVVFNIVYWVRQK